MLQIGVFFFFFFFNDTATTEIYTLSLHDALPNSPSSNSGWLGRWCPSGSSLATKCPSSRDRKSTRLNSSHSQTSYDVFCLKKKTISEIAHTYNKKNFSSNTLHRGRN